MSNLTISLVPTTAASQSWAIGGGSKPDVKVFTTPTSQGVTVFEIECSNASIVVGSLQSAYRAFTCDVGVTPPAGYEMVADCARPWPTVWHPMHAAIRRFAIYPSSSPALRQMALVLAQGIYETPWRRGHAAYGPCNIPLPTLSAQQTSAAATEIGKWLGRLRSQLMTGSTGGVESTSNGYLDVQEGLATPGRDGWRPWGPVERFAHAGAGIYFYTGWEQAQDLPAYLWLVMCANHERRWHAYDRASGEVITADRYGDPGPQYQEGTGDPNNGWLPEVRGIASNPDPLILPYDQAHSIRGFRHLVALSEMSGSPMVKRALKGQAAMFRLQLSEIGPSGPSSWLHSLRKLYHYAEAAPHTGTWGEDTGRQLGWQAFVIAQSVKKGCSENKKWCEMFAKFADIAAMPNGIVSRCASPDPSSVWFDPNNDTAHAFEVPIFWHGATGAARYGGVPVPYAMLRAMQSLYEEAPLYPYYSGVGPPQYAYVAKRGGAPYSTVPGGKDNTGDSTHVMAGAALAGFLSEPKRYIAAANRISNTSVLANKLDLREGAGLLALIQRNP